MGNGISQLWSCLTPGGRRRSQQGDQVFEAAEQLDETLGHSFCYVRSSARFLSSPNPSARFLSSPSHSLRFDDHQPAASARAPETTLFRAISGASVSANTSTPRTVLQPDSIYDPDAAADFSSASASASASADAPPPAATSIVNGFESTSSFSALPLQPVPRGGDPIERGFFMSGPIERGVLSGPLDAHGSGGGPNDAGVPFSAPLGGVYGKKRKKKQGISGIRKAFHRSFSEKKRPWVVPVRYLVGGRKEVPASAAAAPDSDMMGNNSISISGSENNVQWASGKAGEDRVHVVVSEEHGWLFVGIYDGFNGPDAPEFLMGNLYRAVFKQLEGLFWDVDHLQPSTANADDAVCPHESNPNPNPNPNPIPIPIPTPTPVVGCDLNPRVGKKVTFNPDQPRKRLWEYLAEDHPEDGLDLSGSDRFAFSVDDALSVSNAGSAVGRRHLLLSKLKHGLTKHKESTAHTRERKLFSWRFSLQDKENPEKVEVNRVEERASRCGRKRKVGPIDPDLVLKALSQALEATELAYLDMTDKFLDSNPELALMGSCLLVVLMRDEDVYVMNVGDSRAIVAQYDALEEHCSTVGPKDHEEVGPSRECIVEEGSGVVDVGSIHEMKLNALQLSTDHSTSIEEEIIRIKNEHPDDNHCIVNDRLKGRLKVTRAFGAGFLKQPKLNDSLLEMFRNEYIGTAPYLSCLPSLCHHKLCPRDQFLILSSDGLYQYLSNEEVVSHVESFMEKSPEGDPAQHLIEEVLFRAAKKAGMDFHELLDIPQGDRRKYHDDVTVMVISLEGRIWKSSGKYL